MIDDFISVLQYLTLGALIAYMIEIKETKALFILIFLGVVFATIGVYTMNLI